MSQLKLKNKTSRNGFDLSKKNAFTAKISELLPVYCKEVLPGDSFDIDVQAFTRTAPVETAAFTQIREYFDFFFVPTNLMWNKFNTWVTSMVDNNQQASGINGNVQLTDQHPYFTSDQVIVKCYNLQQAVNSVAYEDIFGFNRAKKAFKLLHYLGYGDYYNLFPANPYNPANHVLNPFPLLAYQKIYQDYYRNSQWEKAYAPAWNINYIDGSAESLNIPITSQDDTREGMFDLHYANWNKDYFMGLLPNQQFGDAASINMETLLFNDVDSRGLTKIFSIRETNGNTEFGAGNSADYSNPHFVGAGDGRSNGTSDRGANLYYVGNTETGGRGDSTYDALGNKWSASELTLLRQALGFNAANVQSAFTILALRQAEAKQKWAEITQSNQQDYKAQVEAHFGVSVSDAYSDRCKWIGGFDSSIDINEVVNQNLAPTDNPDYNPIADIAGKGVGVTNGHIKFESQVHGYIMCIYHAVPLLDYSLSGVKRQNLKSMVTDYAIPEFDQTGMVSVPIIELTNDWEATQTDLLGYAPRYYDYKTDYDEVHGAFYNGGLQNWVAPVNDEFIREYFYNVREQLGSNQLTWQWFKVNPAVVDAIFGRDSDDDVDSDHLRVNASFKITRVTNLDRNGLPY